jgi:hypothetical protein
MSAIVAGAVSVAAEKVKLDDELEKSDAWKMNKSWKMEKGDVTASAKGTAYLGLKKKITFKEVEFEAEVTPVKVLGKNWKAAGLRIQVDGTHFWQLALIERPDAHKYSKSHFIELKEKKGKVWGAEKDLKRIKSSGTDTKWKYGQTYKLKIKVTKTRIDGIVTDDQGKQVAHVAYQLTEAAVVGGSPILRVSEMQAKFDDIEIEGEK